MQVAGRVRRVKDAYVLEGLPKHARDRVDACIAAGHSVPAIITVLPENIDHDRAAKNQAVLT